MTEEGIARPGQLQTVEFDNQQASVLYLYGFECCCQDISYMCPMCYGFQTFAACNHSADRMKTTGS